MIELVHERVAEIEAAFAEQAPQFEGDEALKTRVMRRQARRAATE